MPRLALVHTVPALIERFRPLVAQALPDWQSYNVTDESLLQDTIRDGRPSGTTVHRLASYVSGAVDAGADAIIVTCSSLGEAADALRPLTQVPLFRIDRGMAAAAAAQAQRVGVLATLATTLGPTSRLIRAEAASAGRDCIVVDRLCDGAFAQLMAGDRVGHDMAVRAAFDDLATQVDLVVLAQASMAGALASVGSTAVPVLTSPELGVSHIAAQLA
ncbi:MAG: Asp/Glu/hydantoin racemase [Xanthobacteraceae bacterium]|jgi:aspartate/glutamate racemase|nr:Asp/Glu/hydantoin racemase [Xanthobacteraceae bacterium]